MQQTVSQFVSLRCNVFCLTWIFLTCLGAFAQNATRSPPAQVCSLQCPSGSQCFNNTATRVTIEWGHNGHICHGQSPGECYGGEVDPSGFSRGPRQFPRTVIQGDVVVFKPGPSLSLSIFNVSKPVYDGCGSGAQLLHSETSTPFEVPTRFLNPAGIKYFISKSANFMADCRFGLKLELYVRSRQQPGCVNLLSPSLGVCSGTGICVSNASLFFTRNFSCKCCDSYEGDFCEELDSCQQSRCQNGGTCTDIKDGINDSFNCSCVPGFDGTFCERDINECESDPCQNGGLCSNGINHYTCLCQPEFEGVNCEGVIPDLCATNPCANGGTCRRSGDKRRSYTCSCPPNFTGRNCTVNFSSSSLLPTSTHFLQTSTIFGTTLVFSSGTVTYGFSSSAIESSSRLLTISRTLSVPLVTTSSVHRTVSPTPTVLSSSFVNSRTPSSFVGSEVDSASSSLVLRTTVVQGSSDFSQVLSEPQTKSPQVTRTMPSIQETSSRKAITSTAKGVSNSTTVEPTVPLAKTSVQTVTPTRTLLSSPVKTLTSLGTVLLSSTAIVSRSTTVDVQETSITPKSATSSLTTSFGTTRLPSSSSSSSASPMFTSTRGHSSTVASILATTSQVVSSPRTPAQSSSLVSPPSHTVLKSASSAQTRLPSTFKPSPPATSTTVFSSSVSPTLPPTPPPRNQTCLHKPCNNGTCFNESYVGYKFRCECPYPTFGPICNAEFELHFPAFGQKSYVEHKEIAFNSEVNSIDMTFQTSAPDGLLLFAANYKERGDFIQLRVVNGKLELSFDTGDSLVVITSVQRVDTNEITTISVRYVSNVNNENKPFGTLQVNNSAEVVGQVRGNLKGIDLYGKWYVGGVPEGFDVRSKTKGNAVPSPSFVGSIRDVQVNGEPIKLTDAVGWYNINEGDMPPCDKGPCQNGGTCSPHVDNPHEYTCTCPATYEGRNCQTYAACESESCNGGECVPKDSGLPGEFLCLCPLGRVGVHCETVIKITVPLFTIIQGYPSYMQYPVPIKAQNGFHVTFQFKLDNDSVSWSDALLVYSAQNEFQGSGDDFFAIGLKNNSVLLQYNLGSGMARIASEPLDKDREWHYVVAGREKRKGYLFVDDQRVKQGDSPSPLMGLNLDTPLYIGGIPDKRQLPSVLEFQSGGFHGSMYDVSIRFSYNSPFIDLDSDKNWAVQKGRNVGNESYDECSPRNPSPPCSNGSDCYRQGATFLCECPANRTGLNCSFPRVPCYGYHSCAGECRPDGQAVACDCPLGKTGQSCRQDIRIGGTPLFQNYSYLAFQNTNNIRERTKIIIRFKPAKLNGILFYVTYDDQDGTGDFLSIILHNGFVKLKYNLATGVGTATSLSAVSLDKWYTVEASRTGRSGSLIFNGSSPVNVVSPGSAVALDVKSHFYLGGVRRLSGVNSDAVDSDVASVQDYSGCIGYFEVNGFIFSLTNNGAVEGRNIVNCAAEDAGDISS